jgi:translocation and assembly module TamB
MGKGLDGILHINSSLRGLVSPQVRLDQASLNGQGTRAQHNLVLSAKNSTFNLEGRAAGRWKDGVGWAGQILQLSNRGLHAFALTAPVTLEIARQRVVLGSARVDLAGADLALHDLTYNAGQMTSSGEFKRLPLAYLKRLAADTEQIDTDLTLTGNWQIAVGDQVNGHLSLKREGGDISYGNDPKIALGLDRLTLDVDAKNNLVQLNVEASGAQLGTLKASAQSQLSLRDGRWGIAGEAPVQGSADLAIKSLAWLQPIIDSAVVFDGSLKAQLRVDGRFAQPGMSGFVTGAGFTVALPEQGLNFKDGHFQATFREQSLQLNELTLKGGDGELTGKGQLTLENASPVLKLALEAKRLEVLSRPDRLLVLSGKSEISATGKDVRVSAQLKADRGSFELPRIDTPTLSDDVVVLGRTTAGAGKRLPYNVGFDLDMDLGDHFTIKGKGLDAQLGGSLRLTGENGALPSSRGTIRVIKGTYTAYGQRLDIDRGYLNFQGPLDNPGLNILAKRKRQTGEADQAVEAGVTVSGTTQTPRVSLVSTPTVPDGEKLSWLLLGHGLEDSSAQEFSVLQAAAGALLDTGDSVTLQQKVARAAGLDEVNLKGGSGLESTVLALGKRLSSRAYVTFEQGVTGASSLVKINYTLTKRVSVRVQAGTSPAVDLFYTFSFD